MSRLSWLLIGAAALAGCPSDPVPTDTSGTDGGGTDSGGIDSGGIDGGGICLLYTSPSPRD